MRILRVLPTLAAVTLVLACAAPAVKTSKLVGQELPVGALVDAEGLPVGTSALAADGPAVLVFYRGHW